MKIILALKNSTDEFETLLYMEFYASLGNFVDFLQKSENMRDYINCSV